MIFGKDKRKRRVERVVEDNYWAGFRDAVAGFHSCLEYASTSGYYSYNEARKIAYDAGYDYCERLLAQRGEQRIPQSVKTKIPARVYADAYASVRLT